MKSYSKEEMNENHFNELLTEGLSKSVTGFSVDFASAGECSAQRHSNNLYGIFQDSIYDVANPFFIVGKGVIRYMVLYEFLSILHGKIRKLTKIGSIKRNNVAVPVVRDITFCRGCGAPILSGRCDYCQSSEIREVFKSEVGSLDAYTIPEVWNEGFYNKILCVSDDLEVHGAIELYNL